jgi:hypothetical protein
VFGYEARNEMTMRDEEDWMFPRKMHSTEDDETSQKLLRYLDREMAGAFAQFQDEFWTVGAAARWIIERTQEAVNGVSVDENLLLDVLQNMQAAFARGDLSVLGSTHSNPVPKELPRATWSVYQLIVEEKNGLVRILPSNSSVSEPDTELFNLRLRRNEVLQYWPDPAVLKVPSDTAHPTTAGAERRCQRWLVELMKENSPQAKSEIFSKALSQFPNISKRGFERAWTAAIEETGAVAWRAPGRRRKEIKSPQ